MELEQLMGLAALPLVVTVLTQHIKQFARAIRDRKVAADHEATPWPLVADGIGMGFTVASWYAGYVPGVETVLAAALIGLAGALVVQQGYKMVNSGD